METRRDQTRALLYAIGVHLVAGFILFAGLLFSSQEKPVIAGGPIDAVFVDLSVGAPKAAPAPAPTPTPAAPKPAPEPPRPVEPPKPEPKPEEAAPPPPPPQAKPDDVTDQRPVLPSVDQEALNLEKQRDELRLEQEKLRRQQEIEQQRMQQLENIRKERERAAAEAAAAERKLADAKAQQEAQRVAQILNQAAPAAPEGSQRRGADVADSLSSEYYGLIRDLVTQSWRRPVNTPVGIRCVVNVRQIIGGEVIGVTIGSPCNAPESVRQSILDAFERASPLPYSGFESVFDPSLPFQFEYDG